MDRILTDTMIIILFPSEFMSFWVLQTFWESSGGQRRFSPLGGHIHQSGQNLAAKMATSRVRTNFENFGWGRVQSGQKWVPTVRTETPILGYGLFCYCPGSSQYLGSWFILSLTIYHGISQLAHNFVVCLPSVVSWHESSIRYNVLNTF